VVTNPSWSDVALVLINSAQIVLLAWIASRGRRRRRQDARTPAVLPRQRKPPKG
jgi:hypothetical protein